MVLGYAQLEAKWSRSTGNQSDWLSTWKRYLSRDLSSEGVTFNRDPDEETTKMAAQRYWRRSGHIPVMIFLQIMFIILFAIFVIYNPNNAQYNANSNAKGREIMQDYPLFQDVHVMIFVGFGFLMTFLKKYGLSAVSLNMMCAVISLQWATLVIGFFHLHYEQAVLVPDGTEFKMVHGRNLSVPKFREEHIEYSHGYIYLDLKESMLFSDFAAASVLISFGAVIGTTSPLQLIVMTLMEIVLFVINEVIGRKFLGAIDAGDSIFVHAFGAYFGLSVSRMLYTKNKVSNTKQGSAYTSDLFSMIGTIFLWMFWPSFNGASALYGEAQHRAILNTYFSLCASVVSAFAFSAFLNEHNKFVMEHIQNATLAGGVAIGAVADLFIQPYGALMVGSVAGLVSVVGFEYLTPILETRFKIHDTCGVHNLHGMPAILGFLLSILLAGIADVDVYGRGLTEIYPALTAQDNHGHITIPITQGQQALNQFWAGIITIIIAVGGGLFTGFVLLLIGRWQAMDDLRRPGSTVIKLALNIGNAFTQHLGLREALPKDAYFDDNLFFEVNNDEKTLIVTHHDGQKEQYNPEHQGKRMQTASEKVSVVYSNPSSRRGSVLSGVLPMRHLHPPQF